MSTDEHEPVPSRKRRWPWPESPRDWPIALLAHMLLIGYWVGEIIAWPMSWIRKSRRRALNHYNDTP
jgi:hypothetical protein